MALKIWLPLTQDSKNQGTSDLTFSNLSISNTVINNSGKLGKCFKNNSATAGGFLSNTTINLGQNQSMFCWVNFTSLTPSSSNLGCGLVTQHRYQTNTGMGLTIKCVSSTTGYLSVNTGNGSSRTYNTYCATTLMQANTWYHVGYTYNGSVLKLYVNGICENTVDITDMSVPADYIAIYSWSFNGTSGSTVYGNYKLNGSLNDVRIYDHCLSQAEIKELSRGLALHYPLDNPYNASNLIENGFGQDGTAHWSGTGQSSTTEIPPNTTIKRSFAGYQSDYVKINPFNSYTISCYLKTISATSGTFYPSIMPYDIDKKFIAIFNCTEGFNNKYRTTLAQPLKKGDTVVYATDLSAWTTEDNYYNYVAIFGYKDSTGHLYPDMEYTQDSPPFAVKGSTKTNINKTNNTITLKAAYTGADRPAGTVICQATAGSTYYYPFGGIAISTLTDWVFKTATFTPNSKSRLRYSAYWRWFCNGINIWNAGIKLIDNTWMSNTVYDCSGNGYNGTITGNLDINSNTPRYTSCLYFDNGLNNYITAPVQLSNDYITMNIWIKSKNGTAGTGNFHMPFNINGGFYEMSINPNGNFRQGFYINGQHVVNTTSGPDIISDKQWHMITATYDGTNIKRYVDGELVQTQVAPGTLTGGALTVYIGGTYGTSTSYATKELYESDARIYATALSAEDIKELYQVSAKVDKDGNFHAFEGIEDQSAIKINKQGQVKVLEINENNKISFDKTGDLNTYEYIEF